MTIRTLTLIGFLVANACSALQIPLERSRTWQQRPGSEVHYAPPVGQKKQLMKGWQSGEKENFRQAKVKDEFKRPFNFKRVLQ